MSQARPPIPLLHHAFGRHDPGPHPDAPGRYEAVLRALARAPVAAAREAPMAREALVERVHDAGYLHALRRFCAAGGGAIDPDTVAGPPTWEAAMRAAGGAAAAVDAVVDAEAPAAVSLGRPPGHHAMPARAMGFCFVNSAAVAAARARERGAERVAVVDWDVHHGNGTQAIFWSDPAVLYASLHRWPFYPGTGAAGERGDGAGEGATLNVPLPAGTGERAWLTAFRDAVVPALVAFAPEVIVVSAGFDAHRDDPLGGMLLGEDTFATMAREIGELGVPVAYVLEGGYDLGALARSVEAVLRAL